MKPLTPELLAAQSSPSPEYDLTIHYGVYNISHGFAGEPWQTFDALPNDLLDWPLHNTATTAAATQIGVLRVFHCLINGKLAIQHCTNGTSPDNWQTAPITLIEQTATLPGITQKPALVVASDNTAYLYYAQEGNVFLRTSTANSNYQSWTPYQVVYGSTTPNAFGPLFATITPIGIHLIAFAVKISSIPQLIALSRQNAQDPWYAWTPHPATNWVAAGIQQTGESAITLYAATDTDDHQHTFAATEITSQNWSSGPVTWGNLQTIWNTTGEKVPYPRYHCVGNLFNQRYYTCIDTATNQGYLAAGGIIDQTNLTEPAIIHDIPLNVLDPNAPTPNNNESYHTPVQYQYSAAYIVGLRRISQSSIMAAIGAVGADDIISYVYTCEQNSAGHIRIVAPPNKALATLSKGTLLYIERHARKGWDYGSALLGFRTTRHEHYPDRCVIYAVDALGVLGLFRPRRPVIYRKGDFTYTTAIQSIAAWAGLHNTVSQLSTNITPWHHWKGGENGLSSLYRILRDQRVSYISDCLQPFAPLLITARPQATYVQYRYGGNLHPINTLEVARIQDANDPNLIVIHGSQSGSDTAEAWAIRLVQPSSPNTHNIPIYYLNRNYLPPRQEALAIAQQGYVQHRRQRGYIEVQANLVQEPHDRVSIITNQNQPNQSEEEYYVEKIIETYEQRLIKQRIYLSAV